MNKYHAQPTTIDNTRFASKREAARYQELLLLQHAGLISDLQLQVRYDLVVNGAKICTYVADFCYYDSARRLHVEDAKGVRTRIYALKKKLLKAVHGIAIEEV